MIRKVRSLYLRYEERYDRWGALGKVLATVEAFRREGLEIDPKKLRLFVNAAFPRTFSCQRTPEAGDALPPPDLLRAEHATLVDLLGAWGVPADRVDSVALEEIGERRCLDTAFLREYLK